MIGRYLKGIWKTIAVSLLFPLVFSIVLFLYDMQIEAVLYAGTIWLVLAGLFLLLDFYNWRKRHLALAQMRNKITIELEGLPEAANQIEEDYQQLLQELFQANKKNEESAGARYEEMLDYYTMWAHQIKTPIAAMQLLLQEEPSERSSELLDQLFRIEQYVEMVLQYLRTESLNADLAIMDQDLDDIIRYAVRKYAKSFIRKRISLNYEAVGIKVLTDKKWLRFVLEQLLANALKYTAAGSISIYMVKEPHAGIHGRKTLVIEDTGMGIEAEDVPRVFEKGFTGYNGRSDKKSTGVGLYLCKRILNRLSHTIAIESVPGEGTRVYVGLDTYQQISD